MFRTVLLYKWWLSDTTLYVPSVAYSWLLIFLWFRDLKCASNKSWNRLCTVMICVTITVTFYIIKSCFFFKSQIFSIFSLRNGIMKHWLRTPYTVASSSLSVDTKWNANANSLRGEMQSSRCANSGITYYHRTELFLLLHLCKPTIASQPNGLAVCQYIA